MVDRHLAVAATAQRAAGSAKAVRSVARHSAAAAEAAVALEAVAVAHRLEAVDLAPIVEVDEVVAEGGAQEAAQAVLEAVAAALAAEAARVALAAAIMEDLATTIIPMPCRAKRRKETSFKRFCPSTINTVLPECSLIVTIRIQINFMFYCA